MWTCGFNFWHQLGWVTCLSILPSINLFFLFAIAAYSTAAFLQTAVGCHFHFPEPLLNEDSSLQLATVGISPAMITMKLWHPGQKSPDAKGQVADSRLVEGVHLRPLTSFYSSLSLGVNRKMELSKRGYVEERRVVG